MKMGFYRKMPRILWAEHVKQRQGFKKNKNKKITYRYNQKRADISRVHNEEKWLCEFDIQRTY